MGKYMINFMPPEEDSSSEYDNEHDNDEVSNKSPEDPKDMETEEKIKPEQIFQKMHNIDDQFEQIEKVEKQSKRPQTAVIRKTKAIDLETKIVKKPLKNQQNSKSPSNIKKEELSVAPPKVDAGPDVSKQIIPKPKQIIEKPQIKEKQNIVKKAVKQQKQIKKVEDDEFGSSSDEEEAKPTKTKTVISGGLTLDLKQIRTDFKKFLPAAGAVKKKNFIGDQIIVEKDEEFEFTARGSQPKEGSSAATGAYAKRMQKISKLYDDSTKEYKEQQKLMGIQKVENQILNKAKLDQKKVEQNKRKLREGIQGGQISNQLRNLSEANIKYKISELNIRTKEKEADKEKLKIAKIEKKEEKSEKPIILPPLPQIETQEIPEKPEIQVADDVEPVFIIQKRKPKGKKKKQSKIAEAQSSAEQEQALMQKLEQEIELQDVNEHQVEDVQIEVDWDALNAKNLSKVEQPKTDENERNLSISYNLALEYFTKDPSILKHLIVLQPEPKPPARGVLQSLFSCLNPTPMLTSARLLYQRDQLMAISKVKLLGHDMESSPIDFSSHIQHHQMMSTIYKNLTGQEKCPQIGSHWQDIGFQGSDPRTDIRGSGMLGILQLLYFSENFPKTLKSIYSHSQNKQFEFPLAIKMFEFTGMCLSLMKMGKLTNLCNSRLQFSPRGNIAKQDIFKTNSQVYTCLVVMYMQQYIQGHCNILNMDGLTKKMKADIYKRGIENYIKDCIGKTDDDYVMLISSTNQNQSDNGNSNSSIPKKQSRKNKYKNEAQQIAQIKERIDNQKKQEQHKEEISQIDQEEDNGPEFSAF